MSDSEKIKAALNIVDVIGDYVRLQKAGANWKGLCPFKKENTPSFFVNEEKQFYYCFGCSRGGDVFSFMMEMEGLTFIEALRTLAPRAGVELSQGQSFAVGKKEALTTITERATQFYAKQLWDGIGQKAVLPYLRERGLTDEVIRKFRVGYAPDGWRNLLGFLSARHEIKDILDTGLIIEKQRQGKSSMQYDRFRDRIIFPITDHSGAVIGYSGRVTPGTDKSQPKYINTPETVLYHKSAVLYGLDHAKAAIKQYDAVVIVEGNMDVIAAHQAGQKNTVAVSGTALTESHLRIIGRYTKTMILFFDADKAGAAAAYRSTQTAVAQGMHVRIAVAAGGKDAADIVQDDPARLTQIIDAAADAIPFFIERAKADYDVSQPAQKQQAMEYVMQIVAQMQAAIEQEEWTRMCAGAFGIDDKTAFTLRDELAATLQRQTLSPQTPQQSARPATPPPPAARSTVVVNQLLGTMVASVDAWKAVIEQAETFQPLVREALFDQLVAHGAACSYSPETCCEQGQITQDDLLRLRDAAAKVQREGEADDRAATETVALLQEQLRTERRQEERATLTQAITTAERSGDHAQLKVLLEKLRDF